LRFGKPAVHAVLATLLTLAAPGFAQDEVSGLTPDAADDDIEEITVYGDKTLLSLKYAMYDAEDDFFKLFNNLNEDDKFDVFCEKRSSTRSRIKRRQCWSEFEMDYDEDRFRQALDSGGPVGVRNEGYVTAMRKRQAAMLKQMVLENPELQKAYQRFGEANIRFYTEREQRCSDNLVCRDPDHPDGGESQE